ncbi:MAG: hypothetical protein P8Y00_01885 [Deltaproteobacteria bacterium]|jgi:antitoxin component of MazEF toxin-antitoxin module
MPTKKKAPRTKLDIDSQELIDMVNSGTPQKEIMEKFGIKTSDQITIEYANALMEIGKSPRIKSDRAPAKKKVSREIFVGKRGSLIVPRDLVSELGFQEGDCFTVRKSKVGISLSKK